MSSLLNAVRNNWDLPFRLATSLAALSLVIGLVIGTSPLEAASTSLQFLGWPESSDALSQADFWLEERAEFLSKAAAMLLFLSLALIGRPRAYDAPNRAGATFTCAAVLLVQLGEPLLPVVAFAGAFVLWAAHVLWNVIDNVRGGGQFLQLRINELDDVESWLRRTWLGALGAAFFVPVAPVRWLVA